MKQIFIIAAVVFILGSSKLFADDEVTKRAQWDQDEAVARVKKVLEIEERGELPWDDIAWETDVDKAIERSEKENKPLFVYIFLKKNIGPENAPC